MGEGFDEGRRAFVGRPRCCRRFVDDALRQVVTGWDGRGRVISFHTTDEDGAGNVLAGHDVTIEWFRYYQVRTAFHVDDDDAMYDSKLVRVVPLL